MNKFEEYAEELGWLDSDERLMYLIDLAKNATTLPPELRTDSRKVNGCVSQIWVDAGVVDDLVQVYYDSDAMITKGITRVVCDCFSNIPVEEAQAIQKEDFEKLGIKELLSAQRRNGLGSLISNIQQRVSRL